MKSILIVDGYNMIYAWPELAALQKESLDHARDRLVEILSGFGAYRDLRIIVVFDAGYVPGVRRQIEMCDGVEVIYTQEGETADSYIEKTAYELRESSAQVFVATSDWAEQTMIFASGAYRLSARDLYRQVKKDAAKMREEHGENILHYRRQDVESRLQNDVRRRLEEWRKRN